MDDQLYFISPFGLEGVRSHITYTEGWGWKWGVHAWDGVEWRRVDSGFARSDRKAMRAVRDTLSLLAEYEALDEMLEEPF